MDGYKQFWFTPVGLEGAIYYTPLSAVTTAFQIDSDSWKWAYGLSLQHKRQQPQASAERNVVPRHGGPICGSEQLRLYLTQSIAHQESTQHGGQTQTNWQGTQPLNCPPAITLSTEECVKLKQLHIDFAPVSIGGDWQLWAAANQSGILIHRLCIYLLQKCCLGNIPKDTKGFHGFPTGAHSRGSAISHWQAASRWPLKTEYFKN